MSSPDAAPSASPPVAAASTPAESTTPPPTSSSTPPAASPPAPSADQSPSAPPPASPSPPPPSPIISASPPASPPPVTTTPPPATASPPPPPPVSPSPPPAATSPPPPVKSISPPPPSTRSPPPPAQSSITPSASPSPPVASSPPPDTSSTSSPPPPPVSTSSPTVLSPPPPATSSTLSPPPPPVSSSSPTTLSPPPPPPSSGSSTSTGTIAAIAVTGLFAVSVLVILFYCCFCKKKKRKIAYYSGDHHQYGHGPVPTHYKDSYADSNIMKQQGWHSPNSQSSDVLLNMAPMPLARFDSIDDGSPKGSSGMTPGMTHSKSWFTYAELEAATNGFSRSNMLGEGGFGCVFKGVLATGQVVAVKQLKSGASQGEKEFQAEVEIISRVHHRHLVSLVGYCIAESQRLLVYDYVANNTLEYHLHKRKGGPVMDWATRVIVARGAARGLAYLHEDCHPRIIHRDIKSANILLDNNFEAQVADFGLAKLTLDTNTHVTTRVMGTFGYLAPEYASSGKLTEKSDVFSFGVVLLELLTGRKPVDVSQPPGEESLVEWARPILAQVESEEDLDLVVDPSLKGVYEPKETMRMAKAAAACVRHSANKRPRMGQVVRALEGETSMSDLAGGLKPGHSSMYGSSFSSADYENGSYSADMRKFRMALNETSGTGMLMNPSGSSSEYHTSLEIDRETRQPMRVPRPPAGFSSSKDFSNSH